MAIMANDYGSDGTRLMNIRNVFFFIILGADSSNRFLKMVGIGDSFFLVYAEGG